MSSHFTHKSLSQGLASIMDIADESNQRPIVWVKSKDQESALEAISQALKSIKGNVFENNVQYVSRDPNNIESAIRSELFQQGISVCGHKSHLLGTESNLFIVDAFSGFDPDLFCLTLGALAAPGILVLMTPEESDWLKCEDNAPRFMARVINSLHHGEMVASFSVDTNQWIKSLCALPHSLPTIGLGSNSIIYTEDQKHAMQAIKKVVNGHRNRPLVITADRGRGKSAAVGAALGELFEEKWSTEQVFITAPTKASVAVLLEHCGERFRESSVEFMAPDELLLTEEKPSLLIVDEAAAIPEGILKHYLNRFHRIVFITTVHGYEGTGRGFEIRFQPYLDEHYPNGNKVELVDPIRWGQGDLLEKWINQTFLLSAELPMPQRKPEELQLTPQIAMVTQEKLSQDDGLLTRLFGLLTQAHYRTSPGDLRDLLDANNFDIWLLNANDHLLGCCLVAKEGGLDKVLIEKVAQGHRRPKGHLIPQSLCQHLGEYVIPAKNIARVVRIAVAPALQGTGLGSLLLGRIEAHYHSKGFAAIGSSFSAHPNVNHFWFNNSYKPLRLGFSKEASSGAHALLVLKNLADHEQELQRLSHQFVCSFLFLLGNEFRDLALDVVVSLLRGTVPYQQGQVVIQAPVVECQSFANGGRAFEDTRYFLVQLLKAVVEKGCFEKLTLEKQELLVESLLKHRSFSDLRQRKLVSGRKAGVTALRDAANDLLALYIN